MKTKTTQRSEKLTVISEQLRNCFPCASLTKAEGRKSTNSAIVHRSPLNVKSLIVHCSLLIVPLSVLSAVPLTWQVDTTRVAPVTFDAYHGETLALEAVLKDASKPLDLTGKTARLYWQTNGMESVYWTTNATVSATNHIAATFTGAMDPGAPTVRGFLGIAGENYRASFVIRFRPSPGYAPGAIVYPPKTLDLAHTVVVNPPWPTQADYAATTTVMRAELKDYVDAQIEGAGSVTPQIVTNIVDAKIAAIPKDGVSTNAVNFVIGEAARTNWLCTVATAQLKANAAQNAAIADAAEKYLPIDGSKTMTGRYIQFYDPTSSLGAGISIDVGDSERYKISLYHRHWEFDDGNSMSVLVTDGTPVLTEGLVKSTFPIVTNAYTKAEANAAYYPKSQGNQLAASVGTIAAHLNAEDARFVSTNYDSVVRTPEAYVEIKINNNWQTIWREMTRWDKFTGAAFDWTNWGGFNTWRTNVNEQLANKADRCWGIYDSETGEYSPDGFTQISSSNILIASGMAYRRAVETKNIWVLQCNGGTATLGGETNGYFRIKDGDGNTQFEIIKGNQRELGCDADSITVSDNQSYTVVGIDYSVVANQHPTLKICDDLSTADWKTEGTQGCIGRVSWSGSSGAYHANVRVYNTRPAAFIKATYLGGSETVINNVAPTKMQYIYIGNQKYAIGYTTINGTGVMTLTPQ